MKKRIGIIVAIVLSLSIFTLTALASTNSLEGYELLKDVMQTQNNYTNGTAEFTFSITDNEAVVFGSNGTIMADEMSEAFYFTGELTDGDLTKAFEASGNKELVYFKDVENNLIYQFEPSKFEEDAAYEKDYSQHQRRDYDSNHKMTKAEEQLFDAIIGDMKNKVTLTELGGGKKEIGLSLNQSDIPLPVNLLIGLAVEGDDGNTYDDTESIDAYKEVFPFLEGFDCDEEDMPMLKDQVGIVSLELKTIVNVDNQVEGFSCTLAIDGIDENGDYHLITISGEVNMVSVGQTTVDAVDKSGVNDGDIIIIDEQAIKAIEEKHNY